MHVSNHLCAFLNSNCVLSFVSHRRRSPVESVSEYPGNRKSYTDFYHIYLHNVALKFANYELADRHRAVSIVVRSVFTVRTN